MTPHERVRNLAAWMREVNYREDIADDLDQVLADAARWRAYQARIAIKDEQVQQIFSDLLGHEIRTETPATPEEAKLWGTDTIGGQGILANIVVAPGSAPELTRHVWLVFDDGYRYPVRPDTKVTVIQ